VVVYIKRIILARQGNLKRPKIKLNLGIIGPVFVQKTACNSGKNKVKLV
jgi:hypothetical protein